MNLNIKTKLINWVWNIWSVNLFNDGTSLMLVLVYINHQNIYRAAKLDRLQQTIWMFVSFVCFFCQTLFMRRSKFVFNCVNFCILFCSRFYQNGTLVPSEPVKGHCAYQLWDQNGCTRCWGIKSVQVCGIINIIKP